MPNRNSSTRPNRPLVTLFAVATRVAVLVLLFVSLVAAQQAQTALDPNAIMGFESVGTWSVKGIFLHPGFQVSSTTDRTQGSAAYSITNPPDLMQLTSQPIASTATALTGIGNSGALLQVDVLIPEIHNNVSPGWILAFVSSKSRGLYLVPLGFISINNRNNSYRGGIYSTLVFTIPPNVSSALNGANFNDLTFQFDVISLGFGTYLFDNLRVHSVPLIQSPTGTPPPPGYGGSVNLVVPGNAPVSQTFNLGPTQVPNGFHLKMGTAGATTVQLGLGLDGNPSFTCTYNPDSTDATGKSYILASCTGGFEAGDLVNANWVSMAIVGGDSSQTIRAQLALNPMGDLAGAGLLPPMPTFWGDADTCTPAPVAGSVVTNSTSCSTQTAQANQIITAYFNQVSSANPAPNWIAPPVPEFALRHGDGTPTNNLTGAPVAPGDPPFDDQGDLNPGGTFDAYWRLNGDLTPTAVAGTDENKTHFDASFSAHAVLFGEDVDVADAKVVADTDSGQTTPGYVASTSTGNLSLYVFGSQISNTNVNPSTGFSQDFTWSQPYDLPSISIWVFSLTLGADVDAELKASGSAALSGLDLSVTPSAAIDGHVTGGIGIEYVASGSVDAKVNLATLSTPITAQAKWVLNTQPDICAATLNGSLTGDLNLSSGGGQVNLDASFGPCPLCYTDTETLFKWSPLASETWHLFNDSIDTQLFGLPASLCSFPITVNIVSPTSGGSLSSGLPITLTGSAKPNDSTLPYTSTYTWTFTPGSNASSATVISGGTTANPVVQFGPPTSGTSSSWTIGMNATVTVTGSGGTKVTQTGTATSVPVTVTNLSNGVYISQITSATNGPGIPDSSGIIELGNVPGNITIAGVVAGAVGTLNTTFTAACISYCGAGNGTIATVNAGSTTPYAIWMPPGGGGTFLITMNTTAGGSSYGSATATVLYTVLF
jgi:hypothetical protein